MISDNFKALIAVFDQMKIDIKTNSEESGLRHGIAADIIIWRSRDEVIDIVIKDEAIQNKVRDKDSAMLHLAIGVLSTRPPFDKMAASEVKAYIESMYVGMQGGENVGK